jgi:hypothetical protein
MAALFELIDFSKSLASSFCSFCVRFSNCAFRQAFFFESFIFSTSSYPGTGAV